MLIRKSQAEWKGGIKDGKGTVKFGSGAFEGPYSFVSRFEDGKRDTNPEELIAAAHAGCFSMALSKILGDAGFKPEVIRTTAAVHLEKQAAGFAITTIQLETEVQAAGLEPGKFQELAEAAKKGCPVSKVLTGAAITLSAKLLQTK